MKSLLKGLLLVVFILVFFNGQSQTVEIIPSYGYQFGAKLKYANNYLKAKDSDQYGISVGYGIDDDLIVEFSYTRMSTELRIRDFVVSPTEDILSDLAMDWFMLGAKRYFQPGNVRPFAGGGLGMVVVSPNNVNTDIATRGLSSTTRFALNFKAGVNIMFSDRVGVIFQGDLFLPVRWGGVYFAGGTGGVSSGVSAGVTTVMGSVSGGLVFKLGD